MIIFASTTDDDVVKIHNAKGSDKGFKDLVHLPHEITRSIGGSE